MNLRAVSFVLHGERALLAQLPGDRYMAPVRIAELHAAIFCMLDVE